MKITGSRGWDVRRLGALLLAVFHLGATSALSAADGVLDVERFDAPMHVESEGSEDCAPHHDHAFCQVVRSTAFGAPSQASAQADLRLPASPVAHPPAVEATTPSRGLLPGTAGPRAPPLI